MQKGVGGEVGGEVGGVLWVGGGGGVGWVGFGRQSVFFVICENNI